MKLGLDFGVMAKDISDQLKAQGFELTSEGTQHYERVRHYVNYLRIHSMISDGESHKAYKRLMKKIAKDANPIEVSK
jgi:hypothetical protein